MGSQQQLYEDDTSKNSFSHGMQGENRDEDTSTPDRDYSSSVMIIQQAICFEEEMREQKVSTSMFNFEKSDIGSS